MKKITLLILTIAVTITAYGQSKVMEKDVIGEWKLVIDIDKDQIEREIEDDEDDDDMGMFGEFITKSVVGVVFDFIDELDIYFDFRNNGKVRIEVDIFGVEEVEYADWHINKHGELVIDDTDVINSDVDVWLLDDNRLVAQDRHSHGRKDDDHEVFLRRID
ncbi:MAG: hypothetical protein O2887_07725 [Bacteroidetes bacterium]|nr:hypothetical protein [Bacteroidota bacterium]MDA1120369.1 hypothetical protein [Bacteroidota bacterium]